MTYSLADLPQRMRTKIDVGYHADTEEPCWYWTRAVNSKGYGQWGVNGVSRSVHRVAYELLVGTIPAGLTIDHLCLVKRCCNPVHLEIVTRRENVQRAAALITHCLRGHPLTGDNVILKARRDGSKIRNCRTCTNRQQRDRRARAKAQLTA
jgi:hypothetical protein